MGGRAGPGCVVSPTGRAIRFFMVASVSHSFLSSNHLPQAVCSVLLAQRLYPRSSSALESSATAALDDTYPKMLAIRAFSAPVPRQCLRVAPRAAASWSLAVGSTPVHQDRLFLVRTSNTPNADDDTQSVGEPAFLLGRC